MCHLVSSGVVVDCWLLTLPLPSPRAIAPLPPGAAGNPAEVTSLADEIVAHLRGLVGADAMLAAYNQARGGDEWWAAVAGRWQGRRSSRIGAPTQQPEATKTHPPSASPPNFTLL